MIIDKKLKAAIKKYLESGSILECSEFFYKVAMLTFEVLEEDEERHYQADPYPAFDTFTKEELKVSKEKRFIESLADLCDSNPFFIDSDVYLASTLLAKILSHRLEV